MKIKTHNGCKFTNTLKVNAALAIFLFNDFIHNLKDIKST